MFGDFDGMLIRLAIMLVILGIAIGGLFFVGLPWMWTFVKPFIHSVTA